MSLSPVVKGVLDNVLGSPHPRYPGGGFMDENPYGRHWKTTIPAPAPGWGHHPMPPKPAPGWGFHPGSFETMEIKPGWKPSPPRTLPWDGTPSPLQLL